jgi:hypothetical protein
MPDPVLLSGKLGHRLVLLPCHLELHNLVLSNIRDLDLLAESFEDTIISCADGSDKFCNLGISLFD